MRNTNFEPIIADLPTVEPTVGVEAPFHELIDFTKVMCLTVEQQILAALLRIEVLLTKPEQKSDVTAGLVPVVFTDLSRDKRHQPDKRRDR